MTAPTELIRRSRRYPSLSGHVGGLALLFVAAGILVSAVVEAGVDGPEVDSLFISALLVGVVGGVLWRATRAPTRLTVGRTFAAVATTWVVASVAGAVPFILAGTFPTVDDAFFESLSGFTGTGSTVLSPIETQPRGILFWRSMTQWYGGMGMVVLAVSVLPFLGVGGMELMRAEAPGPGSDQLAPRVSETAKRLWLVYAGFTVIAVLLLMLVGMSLYDGVVHAFTIVSTGGLSTYDASIGHFDSVAIEAVVIVLMLAGATNFTLHWRAVRGRPLVYAASSMFRWYISLFVLVSAVLTLLLIGDGVTGGQAIRDSAFNTATLLTSTGYGTSDFVTWVPAAQLILLALMVSGGMAGSTSGGMKLIRVRLMLRHARRELRRVRHPRAVLPVRIEGKPVSEDVMAGIAVFAMMYILLILASAVVVTLLGADLVSAASASTSTMGNMGPALGEAGPASNFLVFTRPARAVLMFMMLAGRLEILPVVVTLARAIAWLSPRRAAARAGVG